MKASLTWGQLRAVGEGMRDSAPVLFRHAGGADPQPVLSVSHQRGFLAGDLWVHHDTAVRAEYHARRMGLPPGDVIPVHYLGPLLLLEIPRERE